MLLSLLESLWPLSSSPMLMGQVIRCAWVRVKRRYHWTLSLTLLLLVDGGSILRGGELWRFIFGHLAFANMSQTVVGLILIYTYRSFERQMGSRKYGAFLFLSWAFSTLVYLALMGIFAATGVSFSPSSGPFFFIFAQLAFFYRKIAEVTFLKILLLIMVAFSFSSTFLSQVTFLKSIPISMC